MSTGPKLQQMEAAVRLQAERLRAQLAAFDAGPAIEVAEPPLIAVEEAATALRAAIATLPPASRTHLTSAELGFMPGPTLDAFIDKHLQDLDKQLSSLAQGAQAVRQWRGEHGRAHRRTFLIRGYIRGFAHQWRQAGQGEPEVAAGSPFFRLASECLGWAGVRDVTEKMVADALGRAWRIASGLRRASRDH